MPPQRGMCSVRLKMCVHVYMESWMPVLSVCHTAHACHESPLSGFPLHPNFGGLSVTMSHGTGDQPVVSRGMRWLKNRDLGRPLMTPRDP